jgi:hypothetical protein
MRLIKIAILFFLLSQVSSATITFVQRNGSCCGNPAVITLPGATTTGNILFASPSVLRDTTHTVSSITGGGVTTWHKISGTSVYSLVELWYGVVTAGASTSITINYTGASGIAESWVAEFHSSVAGTWTVDQSTTNTSNVSPVSSGSLTTTVGAELMFVSASCSSTWLTTASNSFTSLGATSDFAQAAYRIVSSTGTYNTSWTFSGGGVEANIASVYVQAVTPTTFVPPNIY